MKFKSIAQFNLFKNVASGLRKVAGLTSTQAAKDIKGKTSKGLPKKVSQPKKKYVKK